MDKYLIAFDLDGTLKRSNGKISLYSRNIIDKVICMGHTVVLATGRTFMYTMNVSSELDTSPYIITLSGSEVYDKTLGEFIFEGFIEPNLSSYLYDICILEGLDAHFYVGNTSYFVNGGEVDFKENILSLLKGCSLETNDYNAYLRVLEHVRIYYPGSYCIIRPYNGKYILGFQNKETSKGKALKILSDKLNIPLVIAFGDDNNDLSFKDVGEFITPSNGVDTVKSVADVILKYSNNEDGPCRYLKKRFNL